jgi:hypothetical protein
LFFKFIFLGAEKIAKNAYEVYLPKTITALTLFFIQSKTKDFPQQQ